MKRYINQIVCKDVKAGEPLFDPIRKDNLLVFVCAGILQLAHPENAWDKQVEEGHFILLAAGDVPAVTVVVDARILLICAGPLSEMIVNDPQWNPQQPVVLPILPPLARTLSQIEQYQKERLLKLN